MGLTIDARFRTFSKSSGEIVKAPAERVCPKSRILFLNRHFDIVLLCAGVCHVLYVASQYECQLLK